MENLFLIGFFYGDKMIKRNYKIIVIGLLAGFINGFFSTGGGLILVSALTNVLKIDDKKARATSIFCILLIVLATTFFYSKNKIFEWKIALLCSIGGIIGGYIGSILLKKFSKKIIKIFYIVFIFFIAYKMIFK